MIDPNLVAKELQALKGRSAPIGPAGLPKPSDNSDTDAAAEGKYTSEGLTDPGWIGGVTGTGRGRQIAVRR